MKRDWMTLEAFWNDCRLRPLSPSLRLVLSSDGTMVRALNAFFLEATVLEIVEQREIAVDEKTAAILKIAPGEKAIERTVWLNARQEGTRDRGQKRHRVLHAISKFPVSKMKPELYQEIRLGQKPIGRIIQERLYSTRRDHLEIARLCFPNVAKGLQLPEETLFWARRYRLTFSEQVTAIICEVLSPQLSSFSS